MPNLKTVLEVQTMKATIEAAILKVVKDFEAETGTEIDSICCYGPGQRQKETDRIAVRVIVNSPPLELVNKAAEVAKA